MLSVNGSPLANPYELGLNWLAGSIASEEQVEETERGLGRARGQTKTKSQTNSIVVRRDLSFASSSTSSSNSQSGGLHSRNNSQSGTLPTQLTHSRSNLRTGHPASQLGSLTVSARVAVPTKDGHMLEFDPLQTSPSALDKLEGITDSAKKQAKEDMAKLVQAAVAKWNIGT